MNKDNINELHDEELSQVAGGNTQDHPEGKFLTAEGHWLPFIPEYPDIKCPQCGRTGLSALYEPMGDQYATMYCNQFCLSAYCQDENGNLVYLGKFRG